MRCDRAGNHPPIYMYMYSHSNLWATREELTLAKKKKKNYLTYEIICTYNLQADGIVGNPACMGGVDCVSHLQSATYD